MAAQGTKEKTEAELLQQILGAIGEAMAAPDADVEFLQTLQQAIVQHTQQKKQQGQQQVAAAAAMGGGGQGIGQAGGLPAGAGSPPANQIAPGGGAGFAGLSTMSNPDELSRMLGQGSVG